MFSDAIISEIKLEHLNTKCLIQISKFARALHRYNGTVLKLQDKNIVQEVMYHSLVHDNTELTMIYNILKSEIKSIILNKELERSLVSGFSPNVESEPKRQMLN